jgi:PPM family protein phosphatase
MQPAPQLPAVEYAERSDPGRDPDKQVNEDACGHCETRFGHLCIVCDGMGGHAAGREAAELALATVYEVFDRAADGAPPGPLLKEAIEEASRRIHVMRTSEIAMGRPGSTAAAILMHAHGTEIAHVGDSRVYLVHEGQIFRMTRDHSVVQELVDRGILTPAQASHHPDSNRITRALGMASDVEADLRPRPVQHVVGDAFVLCSDGLCDLVEDHEILAVVGAEPPAQAVGKLVDLANARGGHDNISVLVLRARETVFTATTSVAPTIAQTAVTQAPATVPLPPPITTVLEPRASGTEPGIPHAMPARAPELPPAPPSFRAPRRRKPSAPVLIAGVVLALAAFVLLGAVLLAHVADRSGKRNASPTPSTVDAQVPLVPEGH